MALKYRGAYWTDGEREVTLTWPQNAVLSDDELREMARKAAKEQGLDLSRGRIEIGEREELTLADLLRPTIRDDLGITLHDDGTVSYWSVYDRRWYRHRASAVAVRDLTAMDDAEREQIRAHAAQHRGDR